VQLQAMRSQGGLGSRGQEHVRTVEHSLKIFVKLVWLHLGIWFLRMLAAFGHLVPENEQKKKN
jgi:hypothetical protein